MNAYGVGENSFALGRLKTPIPSNRDRKRPDVIGLGKFIPDTSTLVGYQAFGGSA